MASQSRSSLEEEEESSVFSGHGHGYSYSEGEARTHGTAGNGRINSYSISTIMNAASAGPNLAATLNNFNPLRPSGPKSGATRGTPAAPVVVSDLPKVHRRDFDAYLDSVRDDYAQWSKLQAVSAPDLEGDNANILDGLHGEDGPAAAGQLSPAADDGGDALRKKAIAQALANSSLARLETPSASTSAPAPGRSSRQRGRRDLPPLGEIPPLFFEENFSLANPRTFELVTAGHQTASLLGRESRSSSDTIRSHETGATTDFATDQILQEKLTHYLDIVEVHLSVEISLRSASFFSALSNLQALDTQSAQALTQIASLKTLLRDVDKTIAKKGLEKIRQGKKRRRLADLDIALERVKDVLRAVEQAEDMAEAGETEGALDLADELEREWQASLHEPEPDAQHLRRRSDSSRDIQAKASTGDQASGQPSATLEAIGEEAGEEEADSHVDRDARTPIKAPKTPLAAIFGASRGHGQGADGQHPPPVRIAKIDALSSLPGRMARLRAALAHTLEVELVAVLVHELREQLAGYRATPSEWSDLGSGEAAPAAKAREDVVRSLTQRGSANVTGLVRCGEPAVDSAVAAWRAATLAEVRKTLRDLLPSAAANGVPGTSEEDDGLDDSNPSSRSSLEGGRPSLDGAVNGSAASGLRAMSNDLYLTTIRQLQTAMLGCITLSDLQGQILISLISAAVASREGQMSSHDERASTVATTDESGQKSWTAKLATDVSDVAQATAELANIRLAKIVASRADAHAALALSEFVVVFHESWQFVLQCEVICRKMIVGLRGVIVGQAKSFLQAFHQKNLNEAARLVENEQWSPADVTSSTQSTITRILDSAVSNPSAWELSKTDTRAGEGTNVYRNEAKASKHAVIEDRTYFSVGSCSRCVDILEEYLKVVINLPLLTLDTMSRIIEFLKQFNSRVCQLVLGAGAMRAAGLKNITAKHLALASQSLSIMISLIPYIRECLRRHLRAKQAVILVDFDKLKRDYQEHQYEIHAKLVAIMGDRLAVHCKTLQSIDWEHPPAGGDRAVDSTTSANTYMETLVKETGTLHKVLLKYLPGSALETVMMQVLSAISSRLADEYGKIEIRSDAARARILHDARYMRSKFSELRGLERDVPGAELEDLIKMKRKVEPPPPLAAPASAASTPAKMFSTPSLTRSRSSFSQQHRRTPSSASISKAPDSSAPASIAEEPAKSGEVAQSSAAAELRAKTTETASGVNTPDLSTATQVAEPLDLKTDITPDAHLDQPLLDSIGFVAAVQSPADIPLPPSPSIEDPPIEDSKPLAETRLADPAGTNEAAPSTPMKDHKRQLSAPPPLVPEKPVSPLSSPAIAPAPAQVPAAAQTTPAATPTKSPPPPAPVGNVKNRLAGLFNKRPTASLPKIDLPTSLPKIDLPKVSIPASLQRVMSPDKQAGMGSPSQAKSSLDLPRARALMDKQTQEGAAARDREQSHGTAVPEEEPKTAAADLAAPVLSEPKAEPHDEAAGTADKPASPVVPVGEAAVEAPPPADDAAVESAHVDQQVHVASQVPEAISAPDEVADDPSHAGRETADLEDASAASDKETPSTKLVVQDSNEQAQEQGQERVQAAEADAETAPAVSELEPEMQEAKATQEPVPDVAEASTEPGMGDTGEKEKVVSDAPREQD